MYMYFEHNIVDDKNIIALNDILYVVKQEFLRKFRVPSYTVKVTLIPIAACSKHKCMHFTQCTLDVHYQSYTTDTYNSKS